ncbi:MAG TPA: glycosyltransferase family 2 protein [Candidatus Limnocylindrales bacterium]|nr:glycosyltransferase family 2 protein [Candidatus Limnocylindrales bacterium]
MTISLLRIVGLLLALGLLWLGLVRFRRRGSGSRLPAALLLLTGLGLAAVAIAPDLVRPIQDILGLEGEPLGRLVTVLVLSVALAYLLLFYALARADRANQRVSRLVRALSAAQLEVARVGEHLGGVLVVIPAYEEADNLPSVLAEVPSEVAGLPTHVLVVDDGSRDRTAAVAAAHGAHVVSHPVNSGQGAALQTGYLVAERLGVDVVVTLDADGQHDPAELPRLVGPIVADAADFVVGSRRKGAYEAESRTRNVGISIYTRLLNLLGGTEVSDIANGYRAIRASRLSEIAFTEDQFHNPELLLGAARAGLRVVEVPVTIRRRASGTSKKGTSLRYGLGFLRVMLKTWLR